MRRATCFSILASLAITIIPAHQASALDAKTKHTTLTASQKRILTQKKLVTYQTQKNLKSVRSTGAERMLNPQPLPPGPPPDKLKLNTALKNRGSAVSLNPQPLPPGPPPPDAYKTNKLKSYVSNRGSAVSLNPQPLPPGPPPDKLNTALKNRGSAVSLNPQPLPPGPPPPDKLKLNSDRLQNVQQLRTTGSR